MWAVALAFTVRATSECWLTRSLEFLTDVDSIERVAMPMTAIESVD